jgi:hypothetical protein
MLPALRSCEQLSKRSCERGGKHNVTNPNVFMQNGSLWRPPQKAAKVAKKARKAVEQQERQHLRAVRAAEMAQGCQGGLRSVEAIVMEPEVPHPNTSSSIPEHFIHFCTPPNLPFFFSSSPTFPRMPSPSPLSFQQLNIPMQSTQPLHPILQYSSPFQVFHNSLHYNS